MTKKGLLLLALLLSSPSGLPAQDVEKVEEADLPRWIADDIVHFFNDPSTIHFSDRTRIPSTRVVEGDVASLGGPFILAGELDGNLVIVNGDLVFEEGGLVTGDVTVVGGRVLARNLGDVLGNLAIYEERLRYVREGDRIVPADRRRGEEGWGRSRHSWGQARFTVEAGRSYNRVEGLPVVFGPSFRTAGVNPFRLDVHGIWRTEMGAEVGDEDFGYRVRLEQALGGRDRIGVGVSAYSFVDPVEDWGLSDVETSLATVILHEDYRDHYERTGYSAFARFSLPFMPVELRGEFVQEDHEFAPVADPWSLTDGDEPWRPQVLVAEGDVRFVQASLTVDTRNRRDEPSHGWWIQARARQGLGGDLIQPDHRASVEDQASLIPGEEFDTDFATGFLDVRSYNRVGPNSSLNLRGVLGGALNDEALPPQFQHALGGEGSLPGYPLFNSDCGARAVTRGYDLTLEDIPTRQRVFPSYGCDRMALFQAEFRGSLFMDFDDWDDDDGRDEDWEWYPSIEWSPAWAAFFNMGRGWTADGMGDTETLADVGIGIYLGDLGLYWAYPLNEDANGDRSINFFIRFERRF
jgi:hypothetical protein